jgi:hypothetical protein
MRTISAPSSASSSLPLCCCPAAADDDSGWPAHPDEFEFMKSRILSKTRAWTWCSLLLLLLLDGLLLQGTTLLLAKLYWQCTACMDDVAIDDVCTLNKLESEVLADRQLAWMHPCLALLLVPLLSGNRAPGTVCRLKAARLSCVLLHITERLEELWVIWLMVCMVRVQFWSSAEAAAAAAQQCCSSVWAPSTKQQLPRGSLRKSF